MKFHDHRFSVLSPGSSEHVFPFQVTSADGPDSAGLDTMAGCTARRFRQHFLAAGQTFGALPTPTSTGPPSHHHGSSFSRRARSEMALQVCCSSFWSAVTAELCDIVAETNWIIGDQNT